MARRRPARRRSAYANTGMDGGTKFMLLLILVVGLYAAARLMLSWDRPNSDSDARVPVTIAKGMSVTSIADLLYEKKLIRDPLVFRLYIRKNGLTNALQAGEYVVQQNLTPAEVIDVLSLGKSKEMKITIPEGTTLAQLDEMMAKKGFFEPGELKSCAATCEFPFISASLEGFLFPSTYYVVPENLTPKSFLTRLYNTFHQQVEPLKRDIAASGRSLEDVVNVASMVEREAFNDSEMPMVAGIIWKRLEEGIPLGIDATTRYELNDWTNPLYAVDLQRDTPYNTRTRQGLPPTAISNPGLNALTAAARPEASDYLFYLHDANGRIHYGRNLQEHQANKAKYIR